MLGHNSNIDQFVTSGEIALAIKQTQLINMYSQARIVQLSVASKLLGPRRFGDIMGFFKMS